jgi:hypothetical protein
LIPIAFIPYLILNLQSHSTQSVRSVVTNLATKLSPTLSTTEIIDMVFHSLKESVREKLDPNHSDEFQVHRGLLIVETLIDFLD